MLLKKEPLKNKRLFLIIGIITIANLSVMATFPRLHLSTNKKIHASKHFRQAQQLIQHTLLPQLNVKYGEKYDYKLQNNTKVGQRCFFAGTLFPKQKNRQSVPLPFKVFPKNNQILILNEQTKKFIHMKNWLKLQK